MKICREDWERVIEKACEIASATQSDDDPMREVHTEGMMTLLDELEAKYGPQSQLLATRADYLENIAERRSSYEKALALAGEAHDSNEVEEIMDSLNQLGQEGQAGRGAPLNDGPAAPARQPGCSRWAAIGELTN